MSYASFIARYGEFAKDLYEMYEACNDSFEKTEESVLYNRGTMERDEDNPVNGNIVLANAELFRTSFMRYKAVNPDMDDVEARSRVVFDFLQKNGQSFSYEKNAGDVLFGDVTRKDFYGMGEQSIFGEVTGNTNFKDRHVGNMQIICLPKPVNDMPRGAEEKRGMLEEYGVSGGDWQDIMLKRGLYHESVHASFGTTDERKCDAFALLKIMKEHPKMAKLVFDVYKFSRSKIGHTISELNSVRNNREAMERKIKNGTITYMMPETFASLEYYANNPSEIPNDDKGIARLAYSITSKPDFTDEQLRAFYNVVCKDSVSKVDLAGLDVVKACMIQGGFENIDDYIASDKTLALFMNKKGKDMDVVVSDITSEKSNSRTNNRRASSMEQAL